MFDNRDRAWSGINHQLITKFRESRFEDRDYSGDLSIHRHIIPPKKENARVSITGRFRGFRDKRACRNSLFKPRR